MEDWDAPSLAISESQWLLTVMIRIQKEAQHYRERLVLDTGPVSRVASGISDCKYLRVTLYK